MDVNPTNPFTLFLVLVLLILGSPNEGTHLDRHLDYMVNSLQGVRNSIQTVRQGFQTFHATMMPPAPVVRDEDRAWPTPPPVD